MGYQMATTLCRESHLADGPSQTPGEGDKR